MNSFADTLTFYDLQKMPLEILKEIVESIGGDSTSYQKNGLTDFIWENLNDDKVKRNEILSEYNYTFFANKASLSWYKAASLKDLKSKIIDKCGTDITNGQLSFEEENIGSLPILFSIADCPNDLGSNCFIARYIFQEGFYTIPGAEGNQRIKKIRTATAFVDQTNGIIEVRAKRPHNDRIAKNIISHFDDSPELNAFAILSKHSDNTEQLAKSLDGHLIESIGEPTLPLEDLTDEKIEAIISILEVIDEGLGNEEAYPEYTGSINSARQVLFNSQEAVPFLALILAGLNKISLTALYDSLVTSPLYNSLTPYLTNRGGYVKFSSTHDGITKENTIQVATLSNSIYLTCNSNEVAIKKIRENVIGMTTKETDSTSAESE